MLRKLVAALYLASALRLIEPSAAQSGPLQDLATFPRATLEIAHRNDRHELRKYRFDVWVADTAQRQEQGLMFVRDLPPAQGMLFPQDPPRVATFWMKNTYIELDLLFIGPDRRIVKIVERAHPLRLDPLSSDQPVAAVLEIKGGECSRFGLKAGDRVSWSGEAPPDRSH
jgi:uncharacterized membrane protein (UPF0127 family)